jgi:3-hydroxyacyl-CoA dehydrogenase
LATIGVEDRSLAGGGKVRILCLTGPRANALSHALRVALVAALAAANADSDIRAIVLTGAGRAFSSGLDPAALVADQLPPRVADLTQAIAASPKPVIAALHGLTLSAAAEIALAAHARVARADLRFGLRSALIGGLPDAGGTQRLPQLVGAEAAIRLLRDAAMVGAKQARAMGLVDQVVRSDLPDAAVAMVARVTVAPRQPGLRNGRAYQAAIAAARVGADVLTRRMIDCVEAAQVLPMDQGLVFEAEAAVEMAATPRAAALRHAMLADLGLASQAAGGVPARHLGLWGTGVLALPALRAGMAVTVADADRAALMATLEKVALAQEADVQAGRLTPEAREAEWARLVPATSPPVADLVIAGADGALGRVLRLGAGLLLPAPGVAEVQEGDDAAVAVATLRRLGLRVAVTGSPGGVIAALKGAVTRAVQAVVAQGVARAALEAGVPAWLGLPVPGSTGHVVVDPGQVEARIMGALVAEGARLLAAGGVRAASDIDALVLAGLGMPRELGGPMYMADQRGLLIVRRDLALWAKDDAVWEPVGLFDDLIAEGSGFGGRSSALAGNIASSG